MKHPRPIRRHDYKRDLVYEWTGGEIVRIYRLGESIHYASFTINNPDEIRTAILERIRYGPDGAPAIDHAMKRV